MVFYRNSGLVITFTNKKVLFHFRFSAVLFDNRCRNTLFVLSPRIDIQHGIFVIYLTYRDDSFTSIRVIVQTKKTNYFLLSTGETKSETGAVKLV